MDDVVFKSRVGDGHLEHLRKFFDRLRKHDLKLNPTKCTFGVPAGKLLGFIISRRGIELDPTKIKAIQELPPPTKKVVMSFLGRLNSIGCFIAQSAVIVESILKLLKKYAPTKWTEDCQKAFDTIKRYLSNLPIFLGGKDMLRFDLGVSEIKGLYGCIHYSFDLNNGPPKKAVKGQALADLLAGSSVDDNPVPLWTYFLDEEVMTIEGEENKDELGWKVYFDGVVNFKGSGIGAILVSDSGQYYPAAAKLNFSCTNNMAEYEACIIGLHPLTWMCETFRTQNEFADALATIASMIQHPDSKYIDPVRVKIRDQPARYAFVEAEIDGKSWCVDIKMYLEKREYAEGITLNQKKTIRKIANGFFLNTNALYKRTPDLGLLRCVDSVEATKLIEEVHAGTCGPHMNGFVLAKKILTIGYYWMTMENDCSKFV
ncbi:uncharacterized protein LOC132044489 [Lycium ferocissimum]|uniref:uncharacterized protein LOC132044489 n=1 Tax=Lycium ferocissimum TaxID=112874 RepID=UPI0028155AE0|nr:uncharacterized protein LOC132044489 [Lycium ferocissimum]